MPTSGRHRLLGGGGAGAPGLLPEGAPLATFTGAFDLGPRYDERRWARLVADRHGAQAHEIELGRFAESIEKIVWHMDEPAAGPGVFPSASRSSPRVT